MRGECEKAAIASTLLNGKCHGYGNMIDCLQMAWARELIQSYGMPVDTALRGAWIDDEEKIKRLASMGRDKFLEAVKEYLGEK